MTQKLFYSGGPIYLHESSLTRGDELKQLLEEQGYDVQPNDAIAALNAYAAELGVPLTDLTDAETLVFGILGYLE